SSRSGQCPAKTDASRPSTLESLPGQTRGLPVSELGTLAEALSDHGAVLLPDGTEEWGFFFSRLLSLGCETPAITLKLTDCALSDPEGLSLRHCEQSERSGHQTVCGLLSRVRTAGRARPLPVPTGTPACATMGNLV